jgi:hypothetical protein
VQPNGATRRSRETPCVARIFSYKERVTAQEKRDWTYQRGIAIMARRGKAGKEIRAWILRR